MALRMFQLHKGKFPDGVYVIWHSEDGPGRTIYEGPPPANEDEAYEMDKRCPVQNDYNHDYFMRYMCIDDIPEYPYDA
jgi:hypothetical protein